MSVRNCHVYDVINNSSYMLGQLLRYDGVRIKYGLFSCLAEVLEAQVKFKEYPDLEERKKLICGRWLGVSYSRDKFLVMWDLAHHHPIPFQQEIERRAILKRAKEDLKISKTLVRNYYWANSDGVVTGSQYGCFDMKYYSIEEIFSPDFILPDILRERKLISSNSSIAGIYGGFLFLKGLLFK